MSGVLYLVGTPIGNLSDMTFRAVEVLKAVDRIACEDTRHSLTLLNHYEIKKPLISYYQHKEQEGSEKILALLGEGKDIALITDAGMPCISDPGAIVVKKARENGFETRVVPGASALTSAISLSGIERKGFTFLGFLPTKKREKVDLIKPFTKVDTTLVIYSSPHDVNDDLKFFYEVLGERTVYVVKEITKMFEGVQVFSLSEANLENPRGEYVLLIEGQEVENENLALSVEEHLRSLIEGGMEKKEAIKQVAKERKLPKDDVYKLTLKDR